MGAGEDQLATKALILLAGDPFLLWRTPRGNTRTHMQRMHAHIWFHIAQKGPFCTSSICSLKSSLWPHRCPASPVVVLWQGVGKKSEWPVGATGRQAGGAETREHTSPSRPPFIIQFSGAKCLLSAHCRFPPSSLSSCSWLLSAWYWHPSSTVPRWSSYTSSCSCSVASWCISCLSTSSASPGVCRWPPYISSCSWKLLQLLKIID